jgi:SAM-dependent methyltransferase
MTDLSMIKGRQREMWAAGDYAAVATPLLIVSELLCEAVDLRAGRKVLDVAAGSGNTALAAARRRCETVGLDYVPSLLERARQRAAVERLDLRLDEGDVENLPFGDGAFDYVLSTFGVMFAPDQHRAARELARVCRAGGRIGLASWTPRDSSGSGSSSARGMRRRPAFGLPLSGAPRRACASCSGTSGRCGSRSAST